MHKVCAGDFDKMNLLFERHHRNLFGYFYRLTNDAEQSEDMVQIAFYRMLKYRHAYRGEGKFIYWMYSIAKNIWIDSGKKKSLIDYGRKSEDIMQFPSREKTGEDLLMATERKQLLQKAMAQLSPLQKEAIILSKFQGMKYQDIAEMLNCTENTIKSRVHRGLIELKAIMQKLEQ